MRITLSKLSSRLALQIIAPGLVIFYLTGCACDRYCRLVSTFSAGGSVSTTKTEKTGDCNCYCETRKTYREAGGCEGTLGDNGNIPGDFFSNTITAGPTTNFKSSNEEYSYGDHQPGIGFHVGVGTVLPLSKNFAIAPALRFTQKNASEKMEYAGGPGGGAMKFRDNYSYNYIGGTFLAQYRVTKGVSVVAGPEVNYLVSASVKNGGSSGTGEKENIAKTSQKVGLDLLAGVKFEIPEKNRRSRWGLQLMYDHRLSRLNKKKDEFGNEVGAYRMKGVQLGIAYNIITQKKKK